MKLFITVKNLLVLFLLLITPIFAAAADSTTKQQEAILKKAQDYYNEAYQNVIKGQKEKALSNYNKAIELNPDFADAYYFRGLLYSKLGREKEAIIDFTKAYEINPKYYSATARKKESNTSSKIENINNDTPEISNDPTPVPIAKEPEPAAATNKKGPQFPGGSQALATFLSKHLEYPSSAVNKGIEGSVRVQFTIDANGKITDVSTAKGIDEQCDKEAMRLVQSMPEWIPGEINGKKTAFKLTLPIRFALQQYENDGTHKNTEEAPLSKTAPASIKQEIINPETAAAPAATEPVKKPAAIAALIAPATPKESALEVSGSQETSQKQKTAAAPIIEKTAKESESAAVTNKKSPQFPGGTEALKTYLSSHLEYPSSAAEKGIEGNVSVQFTINANGKITDVAISKGIDEQCDKEALRLVKSMPEWAAGEVNGKKTDVRLSMPIRFSPKKHENETVKNTTPPEKESLNMTEQALIGQGIQNP